MFSPPGLKVYASRHYRIHTDLPREDVVPYGRHMDAMYAKYQQRFADFKSRDDQPMPLHLFRSRGSYHAFLQSNGMDGHNSGGMFFVNANGAGLATWVEGKSRSQTLSVLQHEGFHQFAWRHIGTNLPVWANEGLAQYFEDAILVRDRMTVGLINSRRIARVQAAIRADEAVPVTDLLAMTAQQWGDTLRFDPAKSELLYAQAWSIAYFLIHADGGRYRRAFGNYLLFLSQGHDADRAYSRAFGTGDTRNLARAWEAYALQQRPDPISTAAYRLQFIGTALAFLQEQGEPRPNTIGELQRLLASRGFTVTHTSHHMTDTLSATDAALFTYDRPGGDSVSFVLLAPSRDDQPARVAAPGLSPEPTLVWFRDADGRLVQDIAYR